MKTRLINAYLRTLDIERDAGAIAAATLFTVPVIEWEALLLEHPAWMRVGTFDAILAEAARTTATDPARAYEMARFVADNSWRAPVPLHARLMREMLPGDAYLACASALYARREYERGLIFAVLAEDFFDRRAAWVAARTDAKLLRAKISLEIGRPSAATRLLAECAETYADCGDALQCVDALTALAVAHALNGSWTETRSALRAADANAVDEELVEWVSRARSRCSAVGLPAIAHSGLRLARPTDTPA